MKPKILLVLMLSLCKLAIAQNKVFDLYTDSTELKKTNDLLIKDFEASVKKIDKNFTFNGMNTVVEDDLFSGYYLPRTNRIYLPHWPTTPQPILDFCYKVMGGKQEGEKLAAMYFYGFFLPHEIAHGVQFNAKVRRDNEYDNEYDASAMALLYWRKQGKERELKACYQIAKIVVSKLKNPIPANENVKKYFTEHYEEMAQDADKYAFMLFNQIVAIFEDKNLPDFDTYIKQYIARKQ